MKKLKKGDNLSELMSVSSGTVFDQGVILALLRDRMNEDNYALFFYPSEGFVFATDIFFEGERTIWVEYARFMNKLVGHVALKDLFEWGKARGCVNFAFQSDESYSEKLANKYGCKVHGLISKRVIS